MQKGPATALFHGVTSVRTPADHEREQLVAVMNAQPVEGAVAVGLHGAGRHAEMAYNLCFDSVAALKQWVERGRPLGAGAVSTMQKHVRVAIQQLPGEPQLAL